MADWQTLGGKHLLSPDDGLVHLVTSAYSGFRSQGSLGHGWLVLQCRFKHEMWTSLEKVPITGAPLTCLSCMGATQR